MRKLPLVAAVAAAAAAGILVPSGAAEAAPSADTQVTFVVAGQGGDLSITAGPLGAIVPNANGTLATGGLPTASVTDNRNGSPRSWETTASSTDFTGQGVTIPASDVKYEANAIIGKVGGGDVTGQGEKSLGSPATVVTRTGLTWPLEIITWSPALTVDFPTGGLPIGSYSGTVTVSVA
ncbi:MULTISPECIES: hypothetical protein [Gordonia]|uniref:WxL domain-containing protein n=2 Tax=Gordonia TaxID=2053 RepID=L7LH78_9ACTN|nr:MULTISPECIES: hypothetical protein [Gordonia]AUH69862.1 hypothetical protein CXX93_18060 [Gordonia sp. YC-JH1]GAC59418.1 hypothetical protein GSI01S_02_00580 [Gordonia sihwensis NBRC 108236]